MAKLTLGGAPRDVDLVFMDCDGVIFDTNAAKTTAFVESVAGYPEAAREALADYHKHYGGMSRYAKLRHFFTSIHPVDDVDGELARALERFGEVSERAYGLLKPRPEALAFAQSMGVAYVVSGADQNELRRVFERQAIAQHFAAVLGSPSGKEEHMRAVLSQRGVVPERALMVGDGRLDFEASGALGMPFVFLSEMTNWRTAHDELAGIDNVFIADSWSTLSSWLG
jgi:phosphoglycolate phosphatase-like HAD superfamily hydrolase